jgi:hypothetical protein
MWVVIHWNLYVECGVHCTSFLRSTYSVNVCVHLLYWLVSRFDDKKMKICNVGKIS